MSLPVGSVVSLELGERKVPTGLVKVKWSGQRLMMFAVDLRERAERVKGRGGR